jgi:excisionase family DNA binding protein
MVISSKLFYEHGRGYTTPTMPIEPTEERQYTVSEVSEMLGLSRQRVHILIKTGRLKAHRFGPVWMIEESAIAAIGPETRKVGRPAKRTRR